MTVHSEKREKKGGLHLAEPDWQRVERRGDNACRLLPPYRARMRPAARDTRCGLFCMYPVFWKFQNLSTSQLVPAQPTRGSTAVMTITTPTVGFTTADTTVISDGAACGAASATATVVTTSIPSTTTVTISATFTVPGTFAFCYTENGQAQELTTVTVTGPDPTATTPITGGLTATGVVFAISGISMDSTNDDVKLVAGQNSNCQSTSAVDDCCTGTRRLTAGASVNAVVYTTEALPNGGQFTICYRSFDATAATVHISIGNYDAVGPTGYTPFVVPVGTFDLFASGYQLTDGAAQDTMAITTAGLDCGDGAANIMTSGTLVLEAGRYKYTTEVLTPGDTYRVCYRVVGLTTEWFQFANTLTVSGATSYTPITAPGAGDVTLTFTGVDLDSTAVGDSAKLVKGTGALVDCLQDTAVAIAGVWNQPQFTPTDVSGVTQLSVTLNIAEGGEFTMCYKSSLAGAYVPLTPKFSVAGAASFSPTVVPQFFVGDLTVTGALLSATDAIAVIHDSGVCGAAATSLPWQFASTQQGVASIATSTILSQTGNYRVCFTPAGGSQYEMSTPLVVSGAQGVTPTTLIAGRKTLMTITGTNIDVTDTMKLVDQATEDCTAANPGHGVITATGSAGKFDVTMPYGGLFTLCYSLGGTGAYTASATITVNGVREKSPFSPIVAAVGVEQVFELEGVGLSNLDIVTIRDGADCTATPVVSVPALQATSTTLVSTLGLSFGTGGTFLMCYLVSGGDAALPLSPSLTIKGPVAITPTAIDFGVQSTLTLSGTALSTRDTLKLADSGMGCADTSLSSLATTLVTNTLQAAVTPDKGGTFYVCFKPFEGGYVILPTPVLIAGPSSFTPATFAANSATTITFTGLGMTATTDLFKLVSSSDDCTAAAQFTSEQGVVTVTTETVTVSVTPDTVGEFIVCYKLTSQAAFTAFGSVSVTGLDKYSPDTLDAGYDATLTVTGVGLDPSVNRIVIEASGVCPAAAPDLSVSSGVSGTANTLIYRSDVLVGGTNRAVCVWLGSSWEQILPALTVNGPISRTNALPTSSFTAGSPLQFTITGEGLTAFDRVRWARLQTTSSSPACTYPAIADASVQIGTPITTQQVQLPGGSYVMCYSLGASGDFVPVGTPLGRTDTGGVTGEVVLTGPVGFFVSDASNLRIGQKVILGFTGLTAGTSYTMRLCVNGDPLSFIKVQGGDEIVFTGDAATIDVFPLLGGVPQICLKGDGDYIALPEVSQSGSINPILPIADAGNITIQGPTSMLTPRVVGLPYPAGQSFTFTLSGINLTDVASALRWVPITDGCTSATYLTESRASLTLINSTAFSTVFHTAGQHLLCYTYVDDTPQVSTLDLPVVTTYGLLLDTSPLIALGRVGATVSIPYNFSGVTEQPPTHIFFWPQTDSTEPQGSVVCPVDIASTGVRGQQVGTQTNPAYNISQLPAGYHRICADQGAGYYTQPLLVRVRGPTAFTPPSFIVPGQGTLKFEGVQIADTDKVRLVSENGACDGSDALTTDHSLVSLTMQTGEYGTTAKRTVCYQVNPEGEPPGDYIAMGQVLAATGNPVAVIIYGDPVLPSTVVSLTQFPVNGAVVDSNGDTVAITGATMALTADGSPSAPIPYNSGLSQSSVYGKVNFTIALGTVGTYVLAMRYTLGSQSFVVSSADIVVTAGAATSISATIDATTLKSGEAFQVSYFVGDSALNVLPLSGVVVQMQMTPLDTAAQNGQLLGTTTGTSGADGMQQSFLVNLQFFTSPQRRTQPPTRQRGIPGFLFCSQKIFQHPPHRQRHHDRPQHHCCREVPHHLLWRQRRRDPHLEGHGHHGAAGRGAHPHALAAVDGGHLCGCRHAPRD